MAVRQDKTAGCYSREAGQDRARQQAAIAVR